MRILKNRVMNILNGMAVTGFLLAVCGPAIASISTGHNVSAGSDTRTQPSETVTSQVQQTQTDNSAREAAVWGLSDTQWQQYRDVMKGPRGIQSPGIDPVLALGLEAGSAAERRHMAELWVKQEYQRVEKELAFQREVDAAWKRLYPGVLPVNMGGNAAGVAHDTRGRLGCLSGGRTARSATPVWPPLSPITARWISTWWTAAAVTRSSGSGRWRTISRWTGSVATG